jgi:hypothetical protein
MIATDIINIAALANVSVEDVQPFVVSRRSEIDLASTNTLAVFTLPGDRVAVITAVAVDDAETTETGGVAEPSGAPAADDGTSPSANEGIGLHWKENGRAVSQVSFSFQAILDEVFQMFTPGALVELVQTPDPQEVSNTFTARTRIRGFLLPVEASERLSKAQVVSF